jgi:hypothetical protein
VAIAAGPDDLPDECLRTNASGALPTCTQDGSGEWTASYPDDGFEDGGIPGGFVAFGVLALLVGVGVTVWKVSMARSMASEAGMDPSRATAVTLLSDDGLDATYIATSVHGKQATAAPLAVAARGAADRLRELEQLRADGLVTSDEYDSRRRAILDSL